MGKRRIAIGADHGGFALKEKIIKALKKSGYKVASLLLSGGQAPALWMLEQVA